MKLFFKKLALSLPKLLCCITLFRCGANETKLSKMPNPVIYKLERAATNTPDNALIFEYVADQKYFIKVSSSDIKTSLVQDEIVPIQNRIPLKVDGLGIFDIKVTIFQSDGTFFLSDTLTWEYGHEMPPTPNASFVNQGTNNEYAILGVSGDRGPNVKEVWVEGDLNILDSPEGAWYKINIDGTIKLHISDGDGKKNFKIKYRNKYGQESGYSNISTIRKSRAPANCAADVKSTVLRDRYLSIILSAEDEGSLYYDIWGDITQRFHDIEVKKDQEVIIPLTEGDGNKNIEINIRDIANNYCAPIKLALEVNKDYVPSFVKIKDDLLWTTNKEVELQLKFDTFSNRNIEVFISGGVDQGPFTNKWIPFSDTYHVVLQEYAGNRIIYAKFRDDLGNVSPTHYVMTYLRPFVGLQGASSPYILLFSNMNQLESIAVEGCQENYSKISFQLNLPCTSNDGKVQATYTFADGRSVTVSN